VKKGTKSRTKKRQKEKLAWSAGENSLRAVQTDPTQRVSVDFLETHAWWWTDPATPFWMWVEDLKELGELPSRLLITRSEKDGKELCKRFGVNGRHWCNAIQS